MNIYKKLVILGLVLMVSLGVVANVYAVNPTLSLYSSGNNVMINVSGDPNSNVVLYYNLSYGTQSTVLGTTNSSGFLSTYVSANSYNITSGSLVYVLVNNQQSASMAWPSYNYGTNYGTNTGINISNISLSVGNSVTFNSSNGSTLYVSSNSSPTVATTGLSSTNNGCYPGALYSTVTGQYCYSNVSMPVSSNSLTITALSSGSTNIVLCQSNNASACSTFTINVNSNVNVGSVLGTSTGVGCYIGRTLRYGMYGTDVACLQSLLSNRGYGTTTSSYFDQSTYNAVILFQRANYLSADGIVGSRTRNVLMSMSSVMY